MPPGRGRGFGGRGGFGGGSGESRSAITGPTSVRPWGQYGEVSGNLSADRPHTGGRYTSRPSDTPPTELVSTSFGRNVYKATMVSQIRFYIKNGEMRRVVRTDGTETTVSYKLEDTIPYGKNIRFSSKVKGLFVGFGHFFTEPFHEFRNSLATSTAEAERASGSISETEYKKRLYNIEERKLYRKYKLHYISKETYYDGCRELSERYVGPGTGGRTR